MRCDEVKNLLSLYQDDEIEGKVRSEIQFHLTECKNCSHDLEQMEIVQKGIKDLMEIEPAQNFTPLVMGKIKEREKSRLFFLPSMVYSLVFIIFFILGFWVNIYLKDNIRKSPKEENISNLLLQSQNLSLLFVQDKTIDMISGEGQNER